jgi:DNA-binding transcriptional LysR family regulator
VTIDLRLLRHAAALAEHGSFSRAADALGIAQPTLSRSIKDLETSVGLPLFTRSPQGVEPTDFGYVFLKQAAAVSTQLSDLEREVALAKGLHKGELAVGLGPYAAEALLPHALPRFIAAYPAVRVRIQVDSLEVLGRALRLRTLDVLVGEGSILEGEESIEIFEQLAPVQGYVVVRAGHPLTKAAASLRDVLAYPVVQVSRLPPRALRPLIEAAVGGQSGTSQPPMPAVECPTVPLALATVMGSDAVMFASLGMVKRELALGQVACVFQAPWLRSGWAFMRLRHRSLSPAGAAFLAQVRDAHADFVAEEARLAGH